MKYLFLLPISLLFLSCSSSTPIPTEPSIESNYISAEHLALLDFKGKDIKLITIKNKFYYVNKEGKTIQVLTYKNAPDEFSEGLARTKLNGKIGFFNKNLEVILKPVYDYAFPFHNGKAEICTGCKEKKADGTMMLDGGTWKKIDRTGLIME